MPNTREKLIELLRYDVRCPDNVGGCVNCQYHDTTHFHHCDEEAATADFLIAHGVTVQKWISVKDRLPEEHDSIFTSFYGTAKWQDGMFLKVSDTVLASVEYEDGKRRVKAIVTKDGKWDFSKFYRASKVTHWMPLPEPPKGE